MKRAANFWRRLRILMRGESFSRDIEEEMRLHKELKERELKGRGIDPEEARYAANRAFGNTTAIHERSRDTWGWRWLEDFAQDVRFGVRSLRKSPGFTAVAVLTLALGLGINTAVFTLVNAVMLKSLPVHDPEQLFNFGKDDNCCVMSGFQDEGYTLFSIQLYHQLRDGSPEFTGIAAFPATVGSVGVRRPGVSAIPESRRMEMVTGNYFDMLGVRPALGRMIEPGDDRPNAAPVAVMSYRLWSQAFASDPTVVGSPLFLQDLPVTLIGVAPPEFYGDTLRSDPPDLWIPLAHEPALQKANSLTNSDLYWLYLIGRLTPGVTTQQAEAHLNTELRGWLKDRPEMRAEDRLLVPNAQIHLTPARGGVARIRADYANPLMLLSLVSGAVLLIACANLANMLLARGTAQRLQQTLRAALGASRTRLMRQALTESLLLALFGGAIGIAVAFAASRIMLALAFRGADYVPIDSHPSTRVLLFVFALAVLTSLIFGIAPAWIAARSPAAEALRGASRTSREKNTFGRKALIVLQAAVSLVLLSGAGLLTLSLQRLEKQNFGFEMQGRYIVALNTALSNYSQERLGALYDQIRANLKRVPGITNAALSLYAPMSGSNWSFGVSIAGHAKRPRGQNGASWERVTPGYFETIGTKLLRGRLIDERDTPGAQHVALVSENFVKQFLPGEEAVGQHLGLGDASHSGDYEIVGIVADAKYQDAYGPPYPSVFVPFLQSPQPKDEAERLLYTRSNQAQNIELLVEGHPQHLEPDIRETLAAITTDVTVSQILPLQEEVAENFNQERLIARLTALFGTLALLLAAIGLYGVTAYGVAQRTSEIGIRMALGAERHSVLAMVVRGAIWQFAFGIAIGLPLAIAAGHAMAHKLFSVKGYDPTVLGGAVIVLGISALLAGIVPAARAASMDPVQALRVE